MKMYSRLADLLKNQEKLPLNTELPVSGEFENAAVLVLLHPSEGEDHIVFTKRSEIVMHHKGQVSLPGGVVDKTDKNLWKTALRETHEEIGVDPSLVKYIGQLGDIYTPSGFKVTPFVAYSEDSLAWKPNPVEIAEVFTVPVSHLVKPTALQFVTRVFNDKKYQDPVFTCGEHKIWGATGRILLEFVEVWKAI